MSDRKQKLELTWIGKEKRPKLEPRILLEDPDKPYHAKQRVSDHDIFDNRLIFGDNLLALKALEQEFSGKVKCIFIDPPYNTGSAFTHYDDGLEHSIWLGLMRDRLEIIRRLMSEDSSLWITIDDNECHYLKVLCDEVFGRVNFVTSVIWRKNYAPKSSAKHFSVDKVIDGEDKGGVTASVGWRGGGGFRYYKLAPTLIVDDRWGNPVINPDYNAAMLAEAIAKLEGFTYAPSEVQWWRHGHSSERDFIYVTTQNLSVEQLQALAEEVGSEQSLLVCCAAFHGVTAADALEAV